MKTTPFRIYTKDNIELFGLLYEPYQGSKKILVHVHGMAGNFYENKFLDYLASTLTSKGVAFLTFNNRGCEYIEDIYKVVDGWRKVVRIGDSYERFTDCVLDIESAINFVEQKGFTEIHLSGHSLGGPKVAHYASSTKDKRLKSVIFLSPADMVGLAKMDKDYDLDMKMAKDMIAQGKGGELMPKLIWGENYLCADTFIDLSDESSKVAIFNLYNPEDKLPVLSSILVPTLTIMGKKDGALSVPIEQLMERIKKAQPGKAQTFVLGDANHQYDDYQQKMSDEVLKWIKS
jgi:alpha-beta hydrolase superfamily lysophospholipase